MHIQNLNYSNSLIISIKEGLCAGSWSYYYKSTQHRFINLAKPSGVFLGISGLRLCETT